MNEFQYIALTVRQEDFEDKIARLEHEYRHEPTEPQDLVDLRKDLQELKDLLGKFDTSAID